MKKKKKTFQRFSKDFGFLLETKRKNENYMAEEYACSGWIIYIVYKKKHTHRENSLSLREAGHNYSLLYPNNIIKQQTNVFLMMRLLS